jgi:hypothetical protein
MAHLQLRSTLLKAHADVLVQRALGGATSNVRYFEEHLMDDSRRVLGWQTYKLPKSEY